MINQERTQEVMGYQVASLTKGSHKKVVVNCDYCGLENQAIYKNVMIYNGQHSCKSCRKIRIKEKSQQIKEKVKKTCLERYGVENVFQTDWCKEKARSTNIEKLGVEYPMQSEIIREKSRETNLKKYGCENVFQNEDIKEKSRETSLEKYSTPYPNQNKKIKKKIKNTSIKKGLWRTFSGKTIKEWAKEKNVPIVTLNWRIRTYGFSQAIKMTGFQSSLETIMEDFLKEANIKYEKQFNVEGKRADFYIPSHKLIIECDGLFWHCDAWMKDDKYHLNKKNLYIKNGYDSLFFRSHEIEGNFDIVKSIILNKLGKSNRIFARKCEVKEVDRNIAQEFLNKNHLMGQGKGSSKGLYYKEELVALIQTKNTKEGLEISRFCTKLNTSVIGGFSKLLAQIKSPTIINFIDKRYGMGNHLKSLGFKEISTFPSFKWTDGKKVYNRMKYPSNSGYNAGLAKIWDCGQTKFVYGV